MNNRVFWGAICLAVAAILGVSAYSDAARRLPQRDGVLIAGHDGVDQQILKVDDTGTAAMGGSVASSATDSGNPVKIGCVYNSTLPSDIVTTERADVQCDRNGNIRAKIVSDLGAGADGLSNANLAGPIGRDADGTIRPILNAPHSFNGSTWDRAFTCPSSAVINVSAGSTTQLVALASSQIIRVCSFVITGDTAATTATFVYGTGSNCGTGTTSITGAMRMPDEGSIALSGMNGSLFRTIASNALCLTAATGAVTGFVTYAQY